MATPPKRRAVEVTGEKVLRYEAFVSDVLQRNLRPDTSRIYVALGYGFFLELTLAEALKFIDRKSNLLTEGILSRDFLSLDLHLAAVGTVPLNPKSVIVGETFGRTAPVDDGEAPVDAAAESATSPVIPPAVGLPSWEPLVGNWARWLQNAHHASGNQTRLEWLTAAIRTVWPNLMQRSNRLSNSLTKDSMNIKAHIRMLLEGLRELQGMQNFPENPHY
ncbi:protein UXT isoform X2 [Manis javanica]|uniref:protein UXT isoform X2 n=1 Tax=Manis javanica TaxID=9974 RepID=UPI003C6CD879